MVLTSGSRRATSRRAALLLALLASAVIPAGVQSREEASGGAPGSAPSAKKSLDHVAATSVSRETEPAERDAKPTDGAAKPTDGVAKATPFQMVGTVTLAGSGEPVAGAKVRVLIAGFNPDDTHRSREGKTDAQGRYAIEVPSGHSRAWSPTFPPGYWGDAAAGIENFVTTEEKPVFTKNYVARRGPVWRARVVSTGGQALPAGCEVSAYQMRDNGYLVAQGEVDGEGTGRLTIPGSQGEFQVTAYHRDTRFDPLPPATLKFDAGFRSDELEKLEVDQKTQTQQLADKHGRTAILRGARVTVEKGVATIEFELKPQDPKKLGKLTGLIVDEAGEPVEGAQVGIVAGQRNGGSAMTSLRATSDAAGRFVVENAPISQGKSDNTILEAVVTKDGYAGQESEPYALPQDAESPRDLGRIRLGKGQSIRVRVVGPREEPLVGAWVEPVGDYAARTQLTITDEEGECEIRNLKKGVQPFMAHYGDLMTQTKVVIGGPSGEVTLYLKPIPRPPAKQPDPPKSVQKGDPAPELTVSGWSDGRARKLADFRGKVVVLDFWGTWCGPCVNAIPMMKQLEKKYANQKVVFLSIHTAGAVMKQVQELLRQTEWDVPAGLDEGEDVVGGTTVQRYGVTGYPTVIVIDRAGKVHLNYGNLDREAGMKKLEQAAAALSITWPIDEKASDEEVVDRMSRLFGHLYGEAIDQALAEP